LKALVYFEIVSTVALAIGLLLGEIPKPGQGFNIDPAALDPHAVATYVTRAKEEGIFAHLLTIIPNTFVDAFAKGDLLQVLLIAVLTGIAVARLGDLGQRINGAIDAAGKVFFRMTNLVGNGLATVVISRWEGELHRDELNAAMAHPMDRGEALERQAL
jgi:aerobic C4-dicarboxylate transport protein